MGRRDGRALGKPAAGNTALADESSSDEAPSPLKPDVTELLDNWSRGEPGALRELMPQVVGELRRVANGYFSSERDDHTLQPTALVNEVFLKFADRREVSWQNRSHFFGCAAQMMRRILVDHARRHQASKRGGDVTVLSLDALGDGVRREVGLVELDDALKDLARLDPEGSRIVEMRFFAGLTYDEIAGVLGVPSIRVRRRWTTARAWLYRELSRTDAARDG